MRVEEMALRSEIRQMLNEAGINRETLKDMVKESINDVVKNQVNQVLMERRDEDLSEAVSHYLDSNMRTIIRNCTEGVIKEKLRWMNFSVDVTVKKRKGESVLRCERCPASHEEHYAESYECDWYCLAGVHDEDREEFSDGELGCRLHPMTVKKRVRLNEEAREAYYEDFVAWLLENEAKDIKLVQGGRYK